MSDLDDILWSVRRQSRDMLDVMADARIVWQDSNSRAAEQRFLQPRAEAEAVILKSLDAQHGFLNSASAQILRADEQHRIAAQATMQVACNVEQASQSAQSAMNEANSAVGQAGVADGLSAEARDYIARANAAGSD